MIAEDKLESAVCVIEHMLEMEKYPSVFYKKDLEIISQVLNEYKWYTKQDLVPRDDVIELHDSEDDYCNEKCMYYDRPEYCYMRCIPTARPPEGVEWWNRSPNHDKFDYNEPLKTESMVSAERLIKDAGVSQ